MSEITETDVANLRIDIPAAELDGLSAPQAWPANSVEMRLVSELTPYARNSRTHSEDQIAKLARSIEEFGWTIPVLIDENGVLIAGHGRIMAADLLGIEAVPAMTAIGWSDAKKAAYVIADNKLAEEAGWDEALLKIELGEIVAAGFDIELTGFDMAFLDGIGEEATKRAAKQSLADRFGLVPFTVLSAREGWWQDRKRAWLETGIRSEIGRGENLLQMSDTMLEPDPEKRAAAKKKAGRSMGQDLLNGENPGLTPDRGLTTKGQRVAEGLGQTNDLRGGLTHRVTTDPYRSGPAKATGTQAWVQEKIAAGDIEGGMASNQTGTSIFDPVLCELAYRWFSPMGGTILDPFAGGSVRGLVASRLGRNYVGVDLRGEQVEANRAQLDIAGEGSIEWIEGDSRHIVELTKGALDGKADMIFSCPPYADLEVYSDNPADISTLGYEEFREAYFDIVREAASLLRDDGFACFVVGEVRDKNGNYYGFVPDTIEAFRRAGLEYYNEAILVTAAGSLPMRTAKQFAASRKLGKTHQNILVFVKGSGKAATAAIGEVEFGEIPAEELAGGPALHISDQQSGGENEVARTVPATPSGDGGTDPDAKFGERL